MREKWLVSLVSVLIMNVHLAREATSTTSGVAYAASSMRITSAVSMGEKLAEPLK